MNGLVRWVLDLLYPPKCMLCHKLLEDSDRIICPNCGFELPEFEGPLPKVPFFEKTAAAFFYEGKIRNAVLRFKFHGMQSYAEQFAAWMAVSVGAHLDGTYDLISWVPCSRRRRWTRGFDQSALLAQKLAEVLNVPAVRTLEKIRHNRQQSTLSDAARRRANVIGAYRAVCPVRINGKKILLIDDVLTTGSTLSECGKVLRIAGSGDLVCAVIAVARREKD